MALPTVLSGNISVKDVVSPCTTQAWNENWRLEADKVLFRAPSKPSSLTTHDPAVPRRPQTATSESAAAHVFFSESTPSHIGGAGIMLGKGTTSASSDARHHHSLAGIARASYPSCVSPTFVAYLPVLFSQSCAGICSEMEKPYFGLQYGKELSTLRMCARIE